MNNRRCGKDWRAGVGGVGLPTRAPSPRGLWMTLFLLHRLVTAAVADGGKVQLCDLPDCSVVRRSRLYSDRCDTAPAGWPLLVTATPRSATVYTTQMLNRNGAVVHDDWGNPSRDGTVSWIMAFDDDHNFGPARTQGLRFERVLHQLIDPLKGITSMCTEPIFGGTYLPFLLRHINVAAAHESPRFKSRGVLQFWVEWHSFLREARFPSYQVEEADVRSIFRMAGLSESYGRRRTQANHRDHRPYFSWRELFTIDPEYAARAWEMAHYYGYRYPDVTFEELTCLDEMPQCAHDGSTRSGDFVPNAVPPRCPPGSRPPVTVRIPPDEEWIDPAVGVDGVKGWVDAGCVERRLSNGTYVGLTGVFGKDEDDPIKGAAVTDEWIETSLLRQRQKREEGKGQGQDEEKSSSWSDSASTPQSDEIHVEESNEQDGGVDIPDETIVEKGGVDDANGAIQKEETPEAATDLSSNQKAAGIAALFLSLSFVFIVWKKRSWLSGGGNERTEKEHERLVGRYIDDILREDDEIELAEMDT